MEPTGGTAHTIRLAKEHSKPCLVLDLLADPNPDDTVEWLGKHRVWVLNVAGPRGSSNPEIYPSACRFLRSIFVPEG